MAPGRYVSAILTNSVTGWRQKPRLTGKAMHDRISVLGVAGYPARYLFYNKV